MELENKDLSKEQLLELEKNELNKLLDNGVEIEIGKAKHIIKEFYGGTMDAISGELIKLEFVTKSESETRQDHNKHINDTAKIWANIIAIAILNNKWKIRFLKNRLAKQILWQYKPSQLSQIVEVVVQMMNYKDFIYSSILIAGIRTTKPRIEEAKQQA